MNLEHALAQTKTMNDIAKSLGFINLKIIIDTDSLDCFNLLVSVDKTNASARSIYASALEAELVEIFKSEIDIKVYVETTLKPLYRESILEQSAPIMDVEKLASLIQKPLKDIILRKSTLTKEDLLAGLDLAKKIKATHVPAGLFFQETKELVSPSKHTPTNLDYKDVLTKISEDKQIGEAIFSRLDSDTISKINSAYQQLITENSQAVKL